MPPACFYKSPKDLEIAINLYFEHCDKNEKHYTIPGLAYHLGYASRFAINELRNKDRFAHTISRARLKIEAQRVSRMLDAKNTRGFEFDLKNNFEYKDKQELSLGLDPDLIESIVAALPEGELRVAVMAALSGQAQIEDKS